MVGGGPHGWRKSPVQPSVQSRIIPRCFIQKVLKASKGGDSTSCLGNMLHLFPSPLRGKMNEGSTKEDSLSTAQGSACCRVAAQAVPRAWLPPVALGTTHLNKPCASTSLNWCDLTMDI